MGSSGNVDERVVQMRFDNEQFSEGVKDTVDDLDNLKDGLKDIGKADNSTMFAGITAGVNGLSLKFSALQIAAFTAVQNIVSHFMSAGSDILKSMTVEPISAGWGKYEEKVIATQTIMNATGKTITAVSGELERLNTFVDETSYSFSDMVTNIGKFTSSGVKLETAVTAMQGIATWAAVSGANTEKASGAMDIMSKAMGTGYLSLKEWRSLEAINMTTVEFKQSLLDAAMAVGTLEKKGDQYFVKGVKDASVTMGNFTDNLKDGWVNMDVMQKALAQYGDYSAHVLQQMDETGESANETMSRLAQEGANVDIVWEKMQSAGVDAAEAIKLLAAEGIDLSSAEALAAKEGISLLEAIDRLNGDGSVTADVLKGVADAGGDAQKGLSEMKIEGEQAAKVIALLDKNGKLSKDAMKKLKAEGINVTAMLKGFKKKGETTAQALERMSKTGLDAGHILEYAAEHGLTAAESIEELTSQIKGLPEGKGLEALGAKAFRAAQEAKTLTDAMNSIKDAVATGWMKSFEHIFGNYDEAKDLWTDVANELFDIFAEAGYARNDMLEKWHDLGEGGYKDLVQSIMNLLTALKSALLPIGEAWTQIFGTFESSDLAKIVSMIEKFSKSLILGATNMDAVSDGTEEYTEKQMSLQRVFAGLFSAIDIVRQALSAMWTTIKDLIKVFDPLWKAIGKVVLAFFDWVTGLRATLAASGKLEKIGKTIVGFFQDIVDDIAKVFSGELTVSDSFSKAFGKLFDGLRWVVDKIFGTRTSDDEDVPGALDKVGGAIKKAWDKFTGVFANVKLGALEGPANMFVSGLKWVADTIGGLLKTIGSALGLIDDTTGAFDIKDAGATLGDVAKFLGQGIGPAIKAIFSWLGELVKHINFNDITNVIKGMAAANMYVEISGFFKGMTGIVDGIKNFGQTLKSGGIKGLLLGQTKEDSIGSLLIKIAAAIGILALALSILSKISIGGLVKGVAAIGAIVYLMVLMNKRLKGSDLKKVAPQMLLLAGSIFIISMAFEKVAKLNFAEIVSGVVGFGAIIIGMKSLLSIMKDVKFKLGTAKGLIALGITLYIVASAFKKLASIDIAGIGKATIGFAAILIGLKYIVKVMKDVEFKLGTAKGLIALGITLYIIASAFKKLASIDTPGIAKALVGFTAIVIGLKSVLKVMNGISIKFGTAVGLIALGVTLYIMASTLKKLAELSVGQLAKGIIGLLAVMVILKSLAKTVDGIEISFKSALSLIVLSAALTVLVSAVKTIGDMNVAAIAKGIIGLAAVMVELSLLSKLAGKQKGLIQAGVGLLLISGAMYILVSALRGASDVSIEAFFGVMIMMKAVMIAVQEAGKQAVKSLVGALAIGVVMIAIAGAFMLLNLMDIDSVLSMALSISAVLVAFSIMAGVLGMIPFPAALQAVLNLGILIAGVAVIVAAAGALALIPGISDFMAGGGELLEVIGVAIGKFVGGILGGIAEGTMSVLPAIGTALSEFMTNASVFFAQITAVGDTAITGAKNLAETILIIVGASFMDAVAGWVTGKSSMDTFGTMLIALGKAIVEYLGVVAGISSEDATASAAAIKVLAEAATSIGKEGGLVGAWEGDSSTALKNFADGLVTMAPALVEYLKIVAGVSATDATASAECIKVLADAATSIGNEGVLASLGDGTKSQAMTNFAAGLWAMAPSLVNFLTTVSGVKKGAATNSANAIGAIVSAINGIGTEGGFSDINAGTKSQGMKGFADGLVAMAPALVEFLTAVSGIKKNDATNSANAIGALAAAYAGIPTEGFLEGVMSGTTSGGALAFATALGPLGLAIKAYADSVVGINSDAVTGSASALAMLAAASTELPKVGGIASWFSGEQNIADFGTKLKDFGTAFKDYYDIVGALDTIAITSVSTAIGELVALAIEIAGITDIGKLQTFGEKLKTFGTNWSEYYTSVVASFGADSASAAVLGIRDLFSLATDAAGVDFSSATTLGEQLKTLGKAIGTKDKDSLYNNIKDINIDTFKAVMDELNALITQTDLSGVATFATQISSAGTLGAGAFVGAFNSAIPTATIEATSLTDAALLGVKSNALEYGTAGTSAANSFTTSFGAETVKVDAEYAGSEVAGKAMDGLKATPTEDWKLVGEGYAQDVIDGMDGKQATSKLAGEGLAKEGLAGVKSLVKEKGDDDFKVAGANYGQSFATGISSKLSAARLAAGGLSTAAVIELKRILGIASPSKEGTAAGSNYGGSFADSILGMVGAVANASGTVGETAIGSLDLALQSALDLLQNGSDFDPVIRPVIDLSNVRSGASAISSLLGSASTLSVPASHMRALAVADDIATLGTKSSSVNGESSVESNTKFEFTQINNSPLPLDRLAIYRQTNNQFAQLQKIIEGVSTP